MDEDEKKSILREIEAEKYEKSNTKDSFEIWKMKKYVDDKFRTLYFIVIGGIIGIFITTYFLK